MVSTFGPRLNTVFRSRWRAVWWSAGVLLTAYCSVPSDKPDSSADDASSQTVAAVAGVIDQPTPAPEKHVDPWAKDDPTQAK